MSNCAGSLILGHNNSFYKKILKKYLQKNISNFAHPNIHAVNFSITIKIGTKEVYARIMRADIYPPKVRFSVDIRPQLNRILKELTQVLSLQKVTGNYQDYSLNVW